MIKSFSFGIAVPGITNASPEVDKSLALDVDACFSSVCNGENPNRGNLLILLYLKGESGPSI